MYQAEHWYYLPRYFPGTGRIVSCYQPLLKPGIRSGISFPPNIEKCFMELEHMAGWF